MLGHELPEELDEFLAGSAPAWYSPPLLAAIRGRRAAISRAEEPVRS